MTAPTPAEVIAKLGELDANGIARLLADEDIIGEPGASDESPEARYVRRETGKCIRVQGTGQWISEDGLAFSLPASIVEFVKRFDSGRYPHLIEEEIEDL
jgi:hypothetical protein